MCECVLQVSLEAKAGMLPQSAVMAQAIGWAKRAAGAARATVASSGGGSGGDGSGDKVRSCLCWCM